MGDLRVFRDLGVSSFTWYTLREETILVTESGGHPNDRVNFN